MKIYVVSIDMSLICRNACTVSDGETNNKKSEVRVHQQVYQPPGKCKMTIFEILDLSGREWDSEALVTFFNKGMKPEVISWKQG